MASDGGGGLQDAIRRARGDLNDAEIRRVWDAWQRAQRGESDVRIVEVVRDERGRVRQFTVELPEHPECDHDWRDARNEVVLSGEFCPKCRRVRAGNVTTDGAR